MFYVYVLYLTGRHDLNLSGAVFNVTGLYVGLDRMICFLKWQEDVFGFWSYFSDLLVLMYNLWFAYWADLLVLFYILWYADLIFGIYFLMYLLIYRLPMVINAEILLNIKIKCFQLFIFGVLRMFAFLCQEVLWHCSIVYTGDWSLLYIAQLG